jgi:hypothetical protein
MQDPTFCVSTDYAFTVHLQWVMGELSGITWKGKTNAVRLGVKTSKGQSPIGGKYTSAVHSPTRPRIFLQRE